jgi:polyisoprenoid-binding protein YceI
MAPWAARVSLAIAALVAPMPAAQAEPARYRLDPEHLSIGFLVRHIGYADLLGQFLSAEGGFVLDEEARTVSDIRITIDAASVFSNHQARDEHLRKPDFLDVAQFPTITFVGTSAVATGENTGTVTGDLTIRGVTRPVTLEVTLNKTGMYPYLDNYVAGVSARTMIRRSEFGMTYAVDNGWVGDEVAVIIELEAIREKG